jgi:TPP-dependent pyruvate/acetoin dehydrogenase alpha subunit
MDIEDVVVVATVREEMRHFVDTTGIKHLIEAAHVRMAAHVESDDDSASSEPAEKEPPVTGTGTGVTEDSYNDTKEELAAITRYAQER